MYDDDEEPEGPKSSATTYLSEGNVHFNQGEYKKALDSYTQVGVFNLFFAVLLNFIFLSVNADHARSVTSIAFLDINRFSFFDDNPFRV